MHTNTHHVHRLALTRVLTVTVILTLTLTLTLILTLTLTLTLTAAGLLYRQFVRGFLSAEEGG